MHMRAKNNMRILICSPLNFLARGEYRHCPSLHLNLRFEAIAIEADRGLRPLPAVHPAPRARLRAVAVGERLTVVQVQGRWPRERRRIPLFWVAAWLAICRHAVVVAASAAYHQRIDVITTSSIIRYSNRHADSTHYQLQSTSVHCCCEFEGQVVAIGRPDTHGYPESVQPLHT